MCVYLIYVYIILTVYVRYVMIDALREYVYSPMFLGHRNLEMSYCGRWFFLPKRRDAPSREALHAIKRDVDSAVDIRYSMYCRYILDFGFSRLCLLSLGLLELGFGSILGQNFILEN